MDSKSDEKIPRDIIYDLISRFVINIPEDERKNIVRVCFQIEIAHWFYLDFYCTEENPHLRSCTMKEFTALVLKHIPDMQHHLKSLDEILAGWRDYKRAVPTFGAIVLDKDMTHVLLVQSFLAKASWGFPKGKVNEEEAPVKCAVREVFEETGFDITSLIDENEFIEQTWNEQLTRLYLISGVDRATVFQPRTRMEIKAVQWFPLADLPCSKKESTPKIKKGLGPNNFFMVLPFVKRIRRWINEQQNPRRSRQKSLGDADQLGRPRHKSVGDVDPSNRPKSTQINNYSVSLSQTDGQYKLQRAGNSANTHTPHSAPPRAMANGRKEKPTFKRQLFTADDEKQGSGGYQSNGLKTVNSNSQNGKTPVKISNGPFLARSWTNFKFDRDPLLAGICSTLAPPGQIVRVN